MEKYIVDIYEDEQQASAAIEEFKQKGYNTDEISVIANHTNELSNVTQEVKASSVDGTIAGATTGGVIGMAGVLVGLPAVFVPGMGAVLAAGALATMLGGAYAGAKSGQGGLVNSLMDIGLPEEEAKRYNDDVQDGKFLVIVHPKKNC